MSIPDTMRALQLRDLRRLEEVRLPVPLPSPGELLIRTLATTICTSDLGDIHANPFGAPVPRVLGHEGAGVIAALGDGVAGWSVGQRVAAHPVIPCGTCSTCRRGLGHLCDDMSHLGLDRGGSFAEYFVIPAHRVRALPDGVDAAMGALLEPVAVCLEAVQRARVAEGERVLVIGDGPFGIIICRLALRRRPSRLVFLGRHPFRLSQVPQAVRVNEREAAAPLAAVQEALGGEGADAAILAVGSATGLDTGLRSLRARGRLVVFSGITEPAPLDIFRLHVKELEVLGACNDEDYLDQALACLSDAELGLADLITHRAFELASHGKDEALKVAITFDEAGP